MTTEETPLLTQTGSQPAQRCVICWEPATRLVDGDPSCERHANLVYENQMEDYIRVHMT